MYRASLLFISLFIACSGLGDRKPGGLLDDTGGSALDRDEDDDGVSDRLDCDDQDPTVFPGADEVPYDGIDNDCDAGTPDDDLDGDGFPLAEDCDDNAAAVHPGATEIPGDGLDNDCDASTCLNPRFSQTATHWDIPSEDYPSASSPFSEPAANENCGSGIPEYAVFDLTGDGVLDLVILASPCSDTTVGYDHWLYYAGGSNGFSATPSSWALPGADFAGTQPFGELVADDDCGAGRPEFVSTDITGDGIIDLVILQAACADDATGHDHWLVYEGGAGGFAAQPTAWSLPYTDYPGAAFPFAETIANNDCGGGIPEVVTTDLSGDGQPDLVVLQTPCADGAVGRDFWRVYEGGAAGFSSTATNWTLPHQDFPTADYPFIEIIDNNDCAAGTPEFVTTDLTGDGFADIVVLQSPCGDGTIGHTDWQVYAGGPGGFSGSPISWSLPYADYSSAAYPFIEIADDNNCSTGIPEFVVTELASDGVPDLVVLQAPCADDSTGRTQWKVYSGGATGFSSSAADWGLPTSDFTGASYPFAEIVDDNDCGQGVPEFITTRVDEDGLSDLLVFQSPCADDAVGQSYWSVYFGVCDL